MGRRKRDDTATNVNCNLNPYNNLEGYQAITKSPAKASFSCCFHLWQELNWSLKKDSNFVQICSYYNTTSFISACTILYTVLHFHLWFSAGTVHHWLCLPTAGSSILLRVISGWQILLMIIDAKQALAVCVTTLQIYLSHCR